MNEKIRNLMVRASECREAVMNADGAGEAEKVVTLREAAKGVEKELRTALTEDDDDAGNVTTIIGDPETRERQAIRARASVGSFVKRAIDGQAYVGAEAEYQAACGCSGIEMPLDMLAPAVMPETREIETRAVSPGPDAPAGTQGPIPYVFSRTAAAALGITFPMVPSGVKYFPVLSTAPPAGMKAKSVAADATAAGFTLNTRTPKRATGQFTVRVEDLAVLPDIENSLSGAIGEAVAVAVDKQVLTGDGSGANLNGVLGVATDVSAASALETFATGVARFAALVDGRYANSMADLRAVIGVDTFAFYAGLFETNGGAASSLFDYLVSKMGSMFVSTHVPAKASNAQKGLVMRQRGSQLAEVPLWRGIEMVRDPYSDAPKGEVHVTVYQLLGDPHLPYGASSIVEVHPKIS